MTKKATTGFYLKARYRNWAKPGYTIEFYGFFYLQRNADQAADLIRRINSNTGRYFDTVEVVPKPDDGARCLTWQEWLAHFQGDPRPYATLDGKRPVDVIALEQQIRAADMAALTANG